MPLDFERFNATTKSNVDKINAVAKADIEGINGLQSGSGVSTPAFKTTDLEIWWDPSSGAADSSLTFVNTNTTNSFAGLTIENKAATSGYNSSDVQGQVMYGDHRVLRASTSVFSTLTINSASVGVIALDGSNDNVITRELQSSNSNHGWAYPSTGTWSMNHWYDLSRSTGTGWSIELFFRSNGPWHNNGNLFSVYNEAFRFRFSSNGTLTGVGMKIGSSTWNTGLTFSTNTWYHIVITFDPSLTSNQMKIYRNGSLAAQRTGTSSISSSTWVRALLLIGAYQTNGSEPQHLYLGQFRKYKSPLVAQEVLANYNADKATYGLS